MERMCCTTLTDDLIIKLQVMLRCIIATFNDHVDVCLMSYSVSVVYVALRGVRTLRHRESRARAYNVVWRRSPNGVQGQKTREAESY